MQGTKFPCGDYCVKPLLAYIFEKLGYLVIAPPYPERKKSPYRTGKCAYNYDLVAKWLAGKGCNHILDIHNKYGVGPRARGDIDFMAYDEDKQVLLVAEIKTRLVISEITRPNILVLKLQYHFDEPSGADNAWNTLSSMKALTSRDSPDSITEFIKSVLAGYLAFTGVNVELSSTCEKELMKIGKRRIEHIAAAAITMGYANIRCVRGATYADKLLEFVDRATDYLTACTSVKLTPCLITIYFKPCSNPPGYPCGAMLECRGKCCEQLKLPQNRIIWFDRDFINWLQQHCLPCLKCSYYNVCKQFVLV